jgi:hypothetical protein
LKKRRQNLPIVLAAVSPPLLGPVVQQFFGPLFQKRADSCHLPLLLQI